MYKPIEKWHIVLNHKEEVFTMVISEDERFFYSQKRNIPKRYIVSKSANINSKILVQIYNKNLT